MEVEGDQLLGDDVMLFMNLCLCEFTVYQSMDVIGKAAGLVVVGSMDSHRSSRLEKEISSASSNL